MNPIEMINLIILSFVLIVAAVTDIRFRKIPNLLTFPAVLSGIILHTIMTGWRGFIFSIEGLFLGLSFLMLFYLIGGMGAGDVKLMGAVGGILGPKGVLMAFLCTAIIGGIYAAVLMALDKQEGLLDKIRRYATMLKTFIFTQTLSYIPPAGKGERPCLRYGVVIALGTFLYVFKDVFYRI